LVYELSRSTVVAIPPSEVLTSVDDRLSRDGQVESKVGGP
jgi:hypothetical protein